MFTASATNSKLLYITQRFLPPGQRGPVLSTPKHNGKSGTAYYINTYRYYLYNKMEKYILHTADKKDTCCTL